MNNSNVNKKARLTARQELSPSQHEELLGVLKARFEKNVNRHPRDVSFWAADTFVASYHVFRKYGC